MIKGSQPLARRHVPMHSLNPVLLLVPPAVLSALTWITAVNPVNVTAFACSYAILQCVWGSYLLWTKRRHGLPVFAIIASVYWIFFAAALFWGERRIFVGRFVPVGDDYVSEAVQMAFVGVVCIWAGMKLPLRAPTTLQLPDIDEQAASSWAYLRAVLVITTLISLYTPSIYWFGAGGRNAMTILVTIIPSVAFLLLLGRYWEGNGSSIDKPLLIGVALVHLLSGLSSGWLGSVVNFGLTLGAFYVVIHRRIPWTAILLVVAATFFLQVGKNEFRAAYWNTEASGDPLERAQFWLNASASRWMSSLEGESRADSGELVTYTLERASLLNQVAHVLELTPSQVPFQQGQTYSYLAIALIPRFLWPDKPSISGANQYYQVAYGLTDIRTVDSVSIAIGAMAEGYINFGWFGVVGIMAMIGMMLGIYESFCTADQSNTLVLAIAIALLPQLILVESQLGQYISGIAQEILLTFLVFLPVARKKSRLGVSSHGMTLAPARFRHPGSL